MDTVGEVRWANPSGFGLFNHYLLAKYRHWVTALALITTDIDTRYRDLDWNDGTIRV